MTPMMGGGALVVVGALYLLFGGGGSGGGGGGGGSGTEFYGLDGINVYGKPVDFSSMLGKVVLVTNVASY